MPRKRTLADAAIHADKPRRGGPKYVPKHDSPAEVAGAESTEEAPPKKRAPRQRQDFSQYSADGDLVDIWERRMVNPNHQESQPIRVSTPGMRIRWINLQNRGRFQRARYEQGWIPVHKTELVDEREIWGVGYTTEGYVCRGERQTEMLMKIPEAVYKKIQKRRSDLNRESYAKLRENMGSAGSKHMADKYGGSAGDQAAELASTFKGELKFGTEQASTTELFADKD